MSPEIICSHCPLAECDENSLFCVFRLITSPNDKQLQFVTQPSNLSKANELAARLPRKRKRGLSPERKRQLAWQRYKNENAERLQEYYKQYYKANREKILVQAKARYARKREESTQTATNC